jgi:hypothetical protein
MNTSIKIALGAMFGMAATFSAASARAMPSYVTKATTWTQGKQNVSLVDASTNFCYLSGVSGHFVGGAEWVRVWSGDPNLGSVMGAGAGASGSWWVGGGSLQQGVSASAICLPYSTFKQEPGVGSVNNWTGWASEDTGIIGPTGTPTCSTIFLFIPLSCAYTVGNVQGSVWQGDAAVTLSGITGQFAGGAEWAEIDQATSGTAFNTFTVNAQSFNGVGAWAQPLFVGVPQSGFNPSFYGPNAGPAKAADAGVFEVDSGASAFLGQSNTIAMAPTSKAICYLSKIGGAFGGGGESVQIGTTLADGTEFWTLTVNSQQQNGTSAQARCYALDQSKSL